MTAHMVQPEIDFPAIDREYRARVQSTSHKPTDADYEPFVAALRTVAERSARFGGRRISQNDVRVLLLEDTVDGPRCSIDPHKYSSFFSRARAEGLIVKAVNELGETVRDICTTSPTGNNGKMQVVYRWVS